ncbi:hypothetical protein BZA05DRAFT_406924 [Tricharina praecox]|uniref:uncharacterized protein n=1 Tax=Tricharina praecox TaxID=43433 RepID=UPI00222085A1|nr:uncharacterized protein BZA05DRAFT_406924 [Tricharina praecox]KAI5846087.1 hypothetical protein BZA05DRAFT_406924 [Tricharina praecox]
MAYQHHGVCGGAPHRLLGTYTRTNGRLQASVYVGQPNSNVSDSPCFHKATGIEIASTHFLDQHFSFAISIITFKNNRYTHTMASDETTTTMPPNTLRNPVTHITTHTSSGVSTLGSSNASVWTTPIGPEGRFSLLYTTPLPISNPATSALAPASADSGTLVNAGGALLRYVDFVPGYECGMHRTNSVDFGILVEGELTAIMDDGSEAKLARGDVIVQRGTMHAWRNDGVGWARIAFVLLASDPVEVGGEVLEPRFLNDQELRELKEGWAKKRAEREAV